LPLPIATALSALWPAFQPISLAKPCIDKHLQIGRGPTATAWTPAGERMITLQEGAEGVQSNFLHDRNMMR